MKADNVFRFVAVRPPVRANSGEHRSIAEGSEQPDDAAGEFEREVKRLAVSEQLSVEDASRAHAAAVMDSPDYFLNHPGWKHWLRHKTDIELLIQSRVPLTLSRFKAEVKKILVQIHGENAEVEDFAQDQRFSDLKHSIWTSYYAGVTNVAQRPHDLPDVETLIRFVHLLEAVTNKDEFDQRSRATPGRRPAVPLKLLQLEAVRDVEEPGTRHQPDHLESEFERLGHIIRGLRDAKSHIRSLGQSQGEQRYGSRAGPDVGAGEQAQVATQIRDLQNVVRQLNDRVADLRAEKQARIDATSDSSSRETRPTLTSTASEGATSQLALRFRRSDFRGLSKCLEAFDLIGVDPESMTAAELSRRVEREIAVLSARRHALALAIREPTLVGGGRRPLRKVRRPHTDYAVFDKEQP